MKKLGAVAIGLAVLFMAMAPCVWADDSADGLIPRLGNLNIKAAGSDIEISFSYDNVAGGMRRASLHALMMIEKRAGSLRYAKLSIGCGKVIDLIATISEESDITQGKFSINLPIARESGLVDGDKLTIQIVIANLLGQDSNVVDGEISYSRQWDL